MSFPPGYAPKVGIPRHAMQPHLIARAGTWDDYCSTSACWPCFPRRRIVSNWRRKIKYLNISRFQSETLRAPFFAIQGAGCGAAICDLPLRPSSALPRETSGALTQIAGLAYRLAQSDGWGRDFAGRHVPACRVVSLSALLFYAGVVIPAVRPGDFVVCASPLFIAELC